MRLSKILTVATLCIAASTLFARASLYVGGDVGATSYTMTNGNESTTKSGDMGFGAMFGIGLTRNFAIEGDYTHYGEMADSKIQVDSLGIMLKAVAPVNHDFHLYGKVGVVNLTASGDGDSDSGSGLGFSLGMELRITEPMFIFGQYERSLASVGSSNIEPSMWGIGLRYNF